MCATCGCGETEHHPHHHHHEHEHPHETVSLELRILAKNDHEAAHNREALANLQIAAFNLMSSPGAGKTTLLERTLGALAAEREVAVIEGDQETSEDADRIRAAGARAVQINTGAGCHLDAAMVARALDELGPAARSIVFIENVGNLVCPALFDLGESARVVVASVTEGDDKPLKYPHMFRAADVVVLNKIDLLPHVSFDVARFTVNTRRVNPRAFVIQASATRGDGLIEWYAWLRATSAPSSRSERDPAAIG
jgi:hydrogenase nickel incorporation protein HypB